MYFAKTKVDRHSTVGCLTPSDEDKEPTKKSCDIDSVATDDDITTSTKATLSTEVSSEVSSYVSTDDTSTTDDDANAIINEVIRFCSMSSAISLSKGALFSVITSTSFADLVKQARVKNEENGLNKSPATKSNVSKSDSIKRVAAQRAKADAAYKAYEASQAASNEGGSEGVEVDNSSDTDGSESSSYFTAAESIGELENDSVPSVNVEGTDDDNGDDNGSDDSGDDDDGSNPSSTTEGQENEGSFFSTIGRLLDAICGCCLGTKTDDDADSAAAMEVDGEESPDDDQTVQPENDDRHKNKRRSARIKKNQSSSSNRRKEPKGQSREITSSPLSPSGNTAATGRRAAEVTTGRTTRRSSAESSTLFGDENLPAHQPSNASPSLSSPMAIDPPKPSVELSAEEQRELAEFVLKMSAKDMNIIKHVVRGGKLPKALFKFTHNNVLQGRSFKNEEELIKLAVDELGDEARFIGAQTLTAAMSLLCIASQFSYPVKDQGEEDVGTLRAGNQDLEDMGIHVMSTAPTQHMSNRVLVAVLHAYFGVDHDTAHTALAHAVGWLANACPFTLWKKASKPGQEDHKEFKTLLEGCAEHAAAYNRDFLNKTRIDHVLLYGIIAEKFVNENKVFPPDTNIYSLDHPSHLVQGTRLRNIVESLVAGIILVQDLCGDDTPLDMEKIIKIAAGGFTSYENVGSASEYIITGSYSMEDNDEEHLVDIVRAKGARHFKRLLRYKGFKFDENTFPTHDKFKDDDGKYTKSVPFLGLVLRKVHWSEYDYLGKGNTFGTRSGGFGFNVSSREFVEYKSYYSKEGKYDGVAVALVIPKKKNKEVTSDMKMKDLVIVCGATYAELEADAKQNGRQYTTAFKRHLKETVLKEIRFPGTGSHRMISFCAPLPVFNNKAMMKKLTKKEVQDQDFHEALAVNPDALEQVKSFTNTDSIIPEIFVYSASDNGKEPLALIGSINKLTELCPSTRTSENEGYLWYGRSDGSEVRIICSYRNKEHEAINDKLRVLKTRLIPPHTCWVDYKAVKTAIKNETKVAVKCPTNKGKRWFIFTAVKLRREGEESEEEEEY